MSTKKLLTFKRAFAALIGAALLSACFGAVTSQNPSTPKYSVISYSPTQIPSPIADTGLSATLTEVLGKVQVRHAGQVLFSDANKGDVLKVSEQVKTDENGRARLDLSTGTIVRVSPDSLFTLDVNKPDGNNGLYTRITMDLGRIYIILNGGSIDISTGLVVASVRGSYMMVLFDPGTANILVTCLEGHCSASNEAGNVEFGNGQKVILRHVDENGKQAKPDLTSMDSFDYNLWLNDVPEALEMIEKISKESGISWGEIQSAKNCDQSRALGCNDHPDAGNGNGNGKDKGNGNGKNEGKGGGQGKGKGKP